jgi:hypothetical protein
MQKVQEMIPLDYVAACFDYEPEGGLLRWRARPRQHFATDRAHSTFNARYAGTVAGCFSGKAVCISLSGRRYKAHRLVWLLVYGAMPEQEIDHKDGDPSNNRLANLRLASTSQNQMNRGANRNNPTGVKGVCWDKKLKKWRAQIGRNGRSIYLGLYENPEAASAAYEKAAKRFAGEFARAV